MISAGAHIDGEVQLQPGVSVQHSGGWLEVGKAGGLAGLTLFFHRPEYAERLADALRDLARMIREQREQAAR